jgi:hypothetical protein
MVFNTNTAIAQQPDHTAASSPAATATITPFFLYDSNATLVDYATVYGAEDVRFTFKDGTEIRA